MSARLTQRQKATIDEQIDKADGRQLHVFVIDDTWNITVNIGYAAANQAPVANARVIQGYSYFNTESQGKQRERAEQKKSLTERYVALRLAVR